jgi:hypothetical protein
MEAGVLRRELRRHGGLVVDTVVVAGSDADDVVDWDMDDVERATAGDVGSAGNVETAGADDVVSMKAAGAGEGSESKE